MLITPILPFEAHGANRPTLSSTSLKMCVHPPPPARYPRMPLVPKVFLGRPKKVSILGLFQHRLIICFWPNSVPIRSMGCQRVSKSVYFLYFHPAGIHSFSPLLRGSLGTVSVCT